MPRSFKKQAADDQALLEEVEDISKCTFGVPLEDCFPSPNNEVSGWCVKLKGGGGGGGVEDLSKYTFGEEKVQDISKSRWKTAFLCPVMRSVVGV